VRALARTAAVNRTSIAVVPASGGQNAHDFTSAFRLGIVAVKRAFAALMFVALLNAGSMGVHQQRPEAHRKAAQERIDGHRPFAGPLDL
jgi:hypothetical protein